MDNYNKNTKNIKYNTNQDTFEEIRNILYNGDVSAATEMINDYYHDKKVCPLSMRDLISICSHDSDIYESTNFQEIALKLLSTDPSSIKDMPKGLLNDEEFQQKLIEAACEANPNLNKTMMIEHSETAIDLIKESLSGKLENEEFKENFKESLRNVVDKYLEKQKNSMEF